MRGYADLYKLPEDERIEVIAQILLDMPAGKVIGFIVDSDRKSPGKGDRYVAKLKAKVPQMRVLDRKSNYPTLHVTLIRVVREEPT